jgi:type II secretory pathway pseudopilin PulG
VAIIAILAAIAVPNFLEAQVRSKVSRAKSDMRSYSIAINAYQVDYNRPPLGYTEAGLAYPGIAQNNRFWIFKFLTTPVAYLTSLPTDPFAPKMAGREEAVYYFFNTFYKSSSYTAAVVDKVRAKGFMWVLYSVGPNRNEGEPWIEDMLANNPGTPLTNGISAAGNIYDPSNGTVSYGKIYLTNQGFLTASW